MSGSAQASIIHSIEFPSKNSQEGLIFNFASRYDWKPGLSAIHISPIPELILTESRPISYKVTASGGEEISFSDSTELFNINPLTGVIEFDPNSWSNGERNILITATDKSGNSDYAYMRIVIDYPLPSPKIQEIAPQAARIGTPFSYMVQVDNPSGEPVLFADDVSLFNINPATGHISFIPIQVGSFVVKITAANAYGSDYGYMSLEIQ